MRAVAVACPSCRARLAEGSLRCRFCGADARAATAFYLASHASLLDVVRGLTAEAPRGPRRSAEELVERSRELFFGP